MAEIQPAKGLFPRRVPSRWVCAKIEAKYQENGFGKNIPAIQIIFILLNSYHVSYDGDKYNYKIYIRLGSEFVPKTQLFNLVSKLHSVERVTEAEHTANSAIELLQGRLVYVLFGQKTSGYPFVKDIIRYSDLNKNYYCLDRSIMGLIEGDQSVNCCGDYSEHSEFYCDKNCLIYNVQQLQKQRNKSLLSSMVSESEYPCGWYCVRISDIFIIKKSFESYQSMIRIYIKPYRGSISGGEVKTIEMTLTPYSKYCDLIDKINKVIYGLGEPCKKYQEDVCYFTWLTNFGELFMQFTYDNGQLSIQDVTSSDELLKDKNKMDRFHIDTKRMLCEECMIIHCPFSMANK